MPQLPAFDPKDKPATQEQIHARWLELEASPVPASGYVVDFDERSEKRMTDTLDQWPVLPEIPDVVEVNEGVKTVKWRMADNTAVTFTESELLAFYLAAKASRAARAAVLFASAQMFKADPLVTERTIADPVSWGIANWL